MDLDPFAIQAFTLIAAYGLLGLFFVITVHRDFHPKYKARKIFFAILAAASWALPGSIQIGNAYLFVGHATLLTLAGAAIWAGLAIAMTWTYGGRAAVLCGLVLTPLALHFNLNQMTRAEDPCVPYWLAFQTQVWIGVIFSGCMAFNELIRVLVKRTARDLPPDPRKVSLLVPLGVLVLAVILATVPFSKQWHCIVHRGDSYEYKTVRKLWNVVKTLEKYQLKTGDFPNEVELLEQPGLYQHHPDDLTDAWGNRFVYRYPSVQPNPDAKEGKPGKYYDLFSSGPDGVEGNADDVYLGWRFER